MTIGEDVKSSKSFNYNASTHRISNGTTNILINIKSLNLTEHLHSVGKTFCKKINMFNSKKKCLIYNQFFYPFDFLIFIINFFLFNLC